MMRLALFCCAIALAVLPPYTSATWAPRATAALEARTQQAEPIVLGGKEFAGPYGEGWGDEEPSEISNAGGSATGVVEAIRWQNWGARVSIGWGRGAIYKPGGGYFRRKVAIKLRASTVGTCEGRRAYMTLWVRVPVRPGGPLRHWQKWAGAPNICVSPWG